LDGSMRVRCESKPGVAWREDSESSPGFLAVAWEDAKPLASDLPHEEPVLFVDGDDRLAGGPKAKESEAPGARSERRGVAARATIPNLDHAFVVFGLDTRQHLVVCGQDAARDASKRVLDTACRRFPNRHLSRAFGENHRAVMREGRRGKPGPASPLDSSKSRAMGKKLQDQERSGKQSKASQRGELSFPPPVSGQRRLGLRIREEGLSN